MDTRRFDAIARALADPSSRRRIVGAGILAAALFPAPTLACKKVGKKCDKNKDCCDGARCKGGKKGKCRCKSGLNECGGKCQNLDANQSHCGSCNAGCPTGIPCTDGVCCSPVPRSIEEPAGSCASSDECCAGGTCCTFLDGGGPESKCINLLTHQTACGASCETVVNCLNFQPDRQCVNGACVEI